jgi:hypothetical protein
LPGNRENEAVDIFQETTMTITDIIQQITECGAWVTAAFILTIVVICIAFIAAIVAVLARG